MLTTYGADWFSRRAGSCRLHAIYLNQLRVYMEIAGEIVKHAAPWVKTAARWPSHKRRSQLVYEREEGSLLRGGFCRPALCYFVDQRAIEFPSVHGIPARITKWLNRTWFQFGGRMNRIRRLQRACRRAVRAAPRMGLPVCHFPMLGLATNPLHGEHSCPRAPSPWATARSAVEKADRPILRSIGRRGAEGLPRPKSPMPSRLGGDLSTLQTPRWAADRCLSDLQSWRARYRTWRCQWLDPDQSLGVALGPPVNSVILGLVREAATRRES